MILHRGQPLCVISMSDEHILVQQMFISLEKKNRKGLQQ